MSPGLYIVLPKEFVISKTLRVKNNSSATKCKTANIINLLLIKNT